VKGPLPFTHLLVVPQLARSNRQQAIHGSSRQSKSTAERRFGSFLLIMNLDADYFGHYIQSIDDEPLEFLGILRGSNFGDTVEFNDFSLTQWLIGW